MSWSGTDFDDVLDSMLDDGADDRAVAELIAKLHEQSAADVGAVNAATSNDAASDVTEVRMAQQYFDGLPAEQIRERLKFADMAGATVNQLVEKERLLNQKLAEVDAKIAHEEGRQALRSAKDIVLREYPEFDDEQLYQQVLVPFDSQLAEQYPNADYLPRLREAAAAGRKYLNGRNGAELDSDSWIQDQIARKEEHGHRAPQMRETAHAPDAPRASDYVASDEERYHSRVIAKMRGERLAAQGRNADGTLVTADDEDEE